MIDAYILKQPIRPGWLARLRLRARAAQSFFRQKWWFPKLGVRYPKWMVYTGKSENNMDDLGVPHGTPISGNLQMCF